MNAAAQGYATRLKPKESIMKSKYFENGLALLSALLILTGVMAAANTALAGDMGTLEIHRVAQT